jgi:polyhydroxyalkanoate synthesis regulator protein
MMEIIMQYKNRKIYSKTMNQYVNNAYLKDLINLGTVFRIIDKETNKDITYRFLKRIKNDGKRT